MEYYAIIVAAGKGTRMKSKVPKQFLLLNGKPVLMYSIENFFKVLSEIKIIVVLPSKEIPRWRKLCREFGLGIPHSIVSGGATRFESVQNGLKLVRKDGIVAVHDGVRPLASDVLIRRIFRKAKRFGTAIPVVKTKDSVRLLEGIKSRVIARNSIVFVQTPQCFRTMLLKRAYEQKFHPSFTDDASVVEAYGHSVKLVAGKEENIKITTKEDLLFAEALLKQR
jgi:2-C-methyl-D-erythritol 4-phosphate cytidylyltransferase